METLTKQEVAVVTILAEDGATDEEIARRMFLSVSTVKGHVSRARRKAGARNRTHMALLVCREEG